jgi:hypothetical protein
MQMSKAQKVLRQHLRDPHLRSWIQTNEAWFTANPSALHSLIQKPEMLSALQAQMETKKNKMNRRLSKAQRRASASQNPVSRSGMTKTGRKPLFRLPKLSLSSLNMETATQRLSRAAEMFETIRNLSGMLGK